MWIFLFGIQQEVSILRSFNDLSNRVYDSNAFNYHQKGAAAHYSTNHHGTCYPQFSQDSSMVPMPANAMLLHDNIEYTIPVVALHQCKYKSPCYFIRFCFLNLLYV